MDQMEIGLKHHRLMLLVLVLYILFFTPSLPYTGKGELVLHLGTSTDCIPTPEELQAGIVKNKSIPVWS